MNRIVEAFLPPSVGREEGFYMLPLKEDYTPVNELSAGITHP
jgi:hypothetical protein